MTIEDLIAVFTYKPGWTFEVREDTPGDKRLIIRHPGFDCNNPDEALEVWHMSAIPPSIEYMRSPHDWLHHALQHAEMNELKAWFRLDGVQVYK